LGRSVCWRSTARLLPSDAWPPTPEARGRGVGSRLLLHGIGLCRPKAVIRLSAPAHLETWCERFGFVRAGESYDEDGISHVPMRRDLAATTSR
jgi:ElaA protein